MGRFDSDIRINDDFESLADDRMALESAFKDLQHCLQILKPLIDKQNMYSGSLKQHVEFYSCTVDVKALMNEVDQKLWEVALNKTDIERLITHKEKEVLKGKYTNNPPPFDASDARNLVDTILLNSKDIAISTVQKVFNEITGSYYKAGGKYGSPKNFQNNRKIEEKFRISHFYSWPRSYLEDKDVAFFNDLEIACSIVTGNTLNSYPDRVGDKLKEMNRAEDSSYLEVEHFSLQMFKNGNVVIKFKDLETVKLLNELGANGNKLGV